jgi:hypothetical protein
MVREALRRSVNAAAGPAHMLYAFVGDARRGKTVFPQRTATFSGNFLYAGGIEDKKTLLELNTKTKVVSPVTRRDGSYTRSLDLQYLQTIERDQHSHSRQVLAKNSCPELTFDIIGILV